MSFPTTGYTHPNIYTHQLFTHSHTLWLFLSLGILRAVALCIGLSFFGFILSRALSLLICVTCVALTGGAITDSLH